MRSLLRRILGQSQDISDPDLNSESGRVRLRRFEPHDHALLSDWFSNPESCRLAFGVDTDDETLANMALEYLHELRSDSQGVLLITTSKEQATIGFLRYKLFRQDRRSLARVGILLGPSERRGKGFGVEAMQTLLAYLFQQRAIDLVELDTAHFNTTAQRCFLNCGFQTIRETEIIGLHSKWTERRLIMQLTADRWKKASATAQP